MKRKNIQNSNGITISDSIVMSVKQKHPSMRKLYAAIISIIGMLSVVMAFLGMFHFSYNQGTVLMAFLCFAAFHILTALNEFFIAEGLVEGGELYLTRCSIF